jgi:hypothetical protein
MPNQSFFRPGQTIVLREIWDSKIWSARPGILVQDRSEMFAMYAPPDTMCKHPKTLGGERVKAGNRVRSEWILKSEPWTDMHLLRMTVPGAIYSVLLFWDPTDMKFHDFYINLEDPLRRTRIGFDFMDQLLDVIVAPDLSGWHWKDEDEFAEAIYLGLISKERAAALYREGERVAKWIQSGQSPFNGWENWRPDPACPVPVFPQGWDRI